MILIVLLYKIFYTQYVGILTLYYQHTKFHIPSFNGSLAITKHVATMLFYILKTTIFIKVANFLKTHYHTYFHSHLTS